MSRRVLAVCVRAAVRAAVVLAALVGLAGASAGKTVGILFDDSGSMAPRIHLPTFGAQLLVSTLDGRGARDQLFTHRMSQVIDAFKIPNQDAIRVPAGGVTSATVQQWLASARVPVVAAEEIATT